MVEVESAKLDTLKFERSSSNIIGRFPDRDQIVENDHGSAPIKEIRMNKKSRKLVDNYFTRQARTALIVLGDSDPSDEKIRYLTSTLLNVALDAIHDTEIQQMAMNPHMYNNIYPL